VFVFISYIYILGYLLEPLPNKASLLVLLLLSLGVLLLYFLSLLGLFKAVTDLKILVVLITRLLRRDLSRLVKGIKPVEL
jgi:hypothetical protein